MKDPIIVHLMTMGITQDHVWPIIDRFKPHHIVLLSSRELAAEMEELAVKIRESGIDTTEVVHLEPFTDNALNAMMKIIQMHLNRLKRLFKEQNTTFFIGITGGTNLMILAAGLIAIKNGITLLYVLNPAFSSESNESKAKIIEINPESIN